MPASFARPITPPGVAVATDTELATEAGKLMVPASLTPNDRQADHVRRVFYQHSNDLYAVRQSDTFTVDRSTDFGASWESGGALAALPAVLLRVETTGTLVAVEGTNTRLAGQSPRVWRSTDDGDTWSEVTTLNYRPLGPQGIVETPSGYLVLGEYGNVGSTAYRLMRSTDDGATWSQVAASSGTDGASNPGHWHSVTYDPYAEVLLAVQDRTDIDLYVSDDEGATWDKIGTSDTGTPDMVSPMFFEQYVAWGADDANGGRISRMPRTSFYAGEWDQAETVATINRKAAYFTFPLCDWSAATGVAWALTTSTETISPIPDLAPGSYTSEVYVVWGDGARVSGGFESTPPQTKVGELLGLKSYLPSYHGATLDHAGAVWVNVPSISSDYSYTALPATLGTDPPMRQVPAPPVWGAVRMFRPGRYYGVPGPYTPSTGTASAGVLYVTPLWVPVACDVDRIAVEVTAGTPSAVIRLGIYDSTIYDTPNAVLLDAGTVDASGTGVVEATVAQHLTPGLYWLAAVAQIAAPTVRTIGTAAQPPVVADTFAGSSATSGMNCYYRTSITGVLSAWSGLAAGSSAMKIQARIV